MKAITYLIFLTFSSVCVAEDRSFWCMDLNLKASSEEVSKAKDYLEGKISKPELWPSKGILAAAIGDIDYIKNKASLDDLFDAFYVSLSSDNKMSMEIVSFFKNINSRSKNDVSPLMMAVSCNRVNVVKKIILKGGDVNSKVKESLYDPLFFAIQTRNLALVELLIDKGADCRASKLSNGLTAVDFAKKLGSAEIVDALDKCISTTK